MRLGLTVEGTVSKFEVKPAQGNVPAHLKVNLLVVDQSEGVAENVDVKLPAQVMGQLAELPEGSLVSVFVPAKKQPTDYGYVFRPISDKLGEIRMAKQSREPKPA